MIIREVKEKDFAEILKMEEELFGKEGYNRYSLIQLLRIFSETAFVAEQENKFLGYVLGCVKWNKEAWILSLGAKPYFSRNPVRISKLLIEAIINRFIELGAESIYATTNSPSILKISQEYKGEIIQNINNYFLDGKNRYLLHCKIKSNIT